MKTIGQILKLSCDYIKSKNCSQGRLEVEHLVAHILAIPRLDLYLRYDQPLEENEIERVRASLARLVKGEPLAYIEGRAYFYNSSFTVDSRVLIPRPETERLVDHVVKKLRLEPHEKKVLWDICTGSGCIGISIKKALPDISVVLTDTSSDALDCARQNAKTVAVDVVCIEGDLLEPLKNKQADYIVCNPPYISESDFKTLDTHVRDFEPKQALVGGPTGYEFYERLAQDLPKDCICFVEVGINQAEHVAQLFKASGFQNVQSFFDYSGISRFLEIQRDSPVK